MDKRPVFDFVGFSSAILKDVQSYLPNDQLEWDRDRKTLLTLYQSRGLGVFTIDLPGLDKALLNAFETGRLSLSGLALSRTRSRRDHRPRLFWGLWSRCFDKSGCLRADIDPIVIKFLRTLLCSTKKMLLGCDPSNLYKATKDFYDVEASLPFSSEIWDRDDADVDDWIRAVSPDSVVDVTHAGLFPAGDPSLRSLLSSIQQVADRTSVSLGFYEPSETHFRHGPGAVSDLKSRDYKYEFRDWGYRLESVYPWSEWGSTSLSYLDRLSPRGLDVEFTELASRLIAVPKTRQTPRLIAAEPSSHQWCQQSVRDFLYSRVRAVEAGRSIDFRRQDLSGQLALKSSMTRSHATLDLKEASDRISCWLVQRIFRRNPILLRAMAASRTRFITNEIDSHSPRLHKLRKFSTMGSALTFPVQSLIFYVICVGTGKYLHPDMSISRLSRQVRVFGDDLIVPNDWKPHVVRALESLFLRVNHAKTFSDGNFRESCGIDAYKGYDVTPIRVNMSDRESDTLLLPSRVASSNNLHKGGFWNAAYWLGKTVPQGHSVPVVGLESGVFGFTSFTGGHVPSNLKIRWDHDTQVEYIRVPQPYAKARVVKQDTSASLLQFFTEEPDPFIDYESGVAVGGVPVIRYTRVEVRRLLG